MDFRVMTKPSPPIHQNSKHILIVTDAWHPQINGVVRSLERMKKELEKMGHRMTMLTPDQFSTIPCPAYPEIRLAIGAKRVVRGLFRSKTFDAVHIATEGPIGMAARRFCIQSSIPFTTAYHTKFPEYISDKFRVPVSFTHRAMRWFHSASSAVMVSTPSLARDLDSRGYSNIKLWSRGVDTCLFQAKPRKPDFKNPSLLYVGRVSSEKNIEAFLSLEINGRKTVVGDGPQRQSLEKKYPEVSFVGYKEGAELAEYFSSADVFVFPSKTDTFGLVLLEALASGTPVAAYPVPGPLDVIGPCGPGSLHEDLHEAVRGALKISRQRCRDFALQFSWEESAHQFLSNLVYTRASGFRGFQMKDLVKQEGRYRVQHASF